MSGEKCGVNQKGPIGKAEQKKIDNIKKNNLGEKKYERQKNRYKEQIKTKVNLAINEIIKHERPTEIVCEELTFVKKKTDKKKFYSKKVKMYLGNWMKGYMHERLLYKCLYSGIS
jgi:hypothetical protein